MSNLWALFKAHREGILYLFFGGCTTLVNILVYGGATRLAGLDPLWANTLAWVLSVLFAYGTNRTWVFNSRARGWVPVLKEAGGFFAARIATGLADQAIMAVCVTWLGWPDLPVKIAANVGVIVLNYVLSKWLVFRKK